MSKLRLVLMAGVTVFLKINIIRAYILSNSAKKITKTGKKSPI